VAVLWRALMFLNLILAIGALEAVLGLPVLVTFVIVMLRN
jgi:hypothetical protein